MVAPLSLRRLSEVSLRHNDRVDDMREEHPEPDQRRREVLEQHCLHKHDGGEQARSGVAGMLTGVARRGAARVRGVDACVPESGRNQSTAA